MWPTENTLVCKTEFDSKLSARPHRGVPRAITNGPTRGRARPRPSREFNVMVCGLRNSAALECVLGARRSNARVLGNYTRATCARSTPSLVRHPSSCRLPRKHTRRAKLRFSITEPRANAHHGAVSGAKARAAQSRRSATSDTRESARRREQGLPPSPRHPTRPRCTITPTRV